jgi:2-oxoisovalerate dehydrogenase E1 component beta subunit
MSLNGIRPVAEIQFVDFIYPGFDQIVNEAAKMRYRSGGEWTCPMVIRTPYGGGIRGGHYHSQSPEAHFIHTPGLKVIVPSNPYDAKGLLLASIEDPDPVIFMEPKRVYRAAQGEVPEEPYMIPLGEAKIVRAGDDITIIAWGAMLHEALKTAEQAAESGVQCEVIDLRSLVPWDTTTVMESVKKTGRAVVVCEAPRTLGFSSEIVSQIMDEVFDYLEAPVQRVTGYDTPFPYTLEHEYLPLAKRILPAVQDTVAYQ